MVWVGSVKAGDSMAEKGLLSGIFRKEGHDGITHNTWIVFLTLILIFVLALFLRSYFGWNEATRYGAPFLVSGGSDSYYHERAIYTAAYEHHHLLKDPMLNYPVGSRNPRPPDYDWSIVLIGYLIAPFLGGDLFTALSYSLMISTAFWGALTVFPTYLIGKKAFNRKVGLISAFLLATLPAHMQRSPITDADHDAFVLFFGVAAIYFLLVALENIKEKEWVEKWRDIKSIAPGFKRMFSENRTSFLYGALSASSLLVVAMTWKGFSYMYIIIMLYFVIQLFVNRFRNIDPTTLTFLSAIVLLIPVILAIPFYFGANLSSWLIAPSAMAIIAVGLGAYFSLTKNYPWTLTIPALFIGLAVLGAIAAIFFPSVIETVGRQTGYFTRTKTYQTIAEAQAPYFSNMVLSFGVATFFMALFGVLWILWKMRKNWNPYFVLFVIWSAESIYMALSAARFMFNAAPAFAIASGWVTYYIVKKTDFGYIKRTYRSLRGDRWYALKKSVKVKHVLVALFLVFLVIMPNVWYAIDAGIPSNEKKKYDREIYEAMPDFLRPDPSIFNESSRGTWYLGAFGYSLPTPNQYWPAAWSWFSKQDNNRLPENRPGFLSWWDYGFECIQQGKHPTVADNFLYGHQLAGNFIMAQNESDAISLLAERILDSQFDNNNHKFSEKAIALMTKYLGEKDAQKIEDIYAHPQSYVPEILAHPEKYGPYDSQISDMNARYIATRGVLMKYSKEHLVSFLKALEDMTGKRIGYFAIDSRLIPFSAQNTGIFYAPAVLSDHRMSSGGYRLPYDFYEIYAVTKYGKKYPINEVPDDVRRDIDHTEIEYKDMFYNTMLYRNYFGYSPKDAGSDKNGLPGLSDDLKNMQPMPGWNLTHFRLVYRTAYWNPYKDYKNHSDAWRAIGIDEALKYRKEGKGVVDMSPGTLYNGVTFLEYYEGAIINGTVKTADGKPVGDVRVTVYDKYGIPHQSVKTDSNGRYSIIAPFGNITLVVSNGGSLNKVRMSEKNILNHTAMYIRMDQALREKVDEDGDGKWDYLISKDLVAATSSIKGTVFIDKNNDEKKQDLENGVKAEITIYGKTLSINYTVFSSENGSYEIKNVVPGDYGIKIKIGAYERDLNKTVSVEPNKEKDQDIAVPSGTVKGKISDYYGDPIKNEKFYLKSTEDSRKMTFYTDRKGEFTVIGVIPGTYHIVPENSSLAPSSYIIGVFKNRTSNANITIYRAFNLHGYVSADGKGVPYISIDFINYTFPSMSRTVTADKHGYYSVNLPRGEYTVHATYINGKKRYTLLKHISVYSNESLSLNMVNPHRIHGYVRFKGYYENSNKHFISYKDAFPVMFVKNDGSVYYAYSVKGNYTAYLPDGNYEVFVSHTALGHPYAFSGKLNVYKDAEYDIDLITGEIVKGTIYGVANTTVKGAKISFTNNTTLSVISDSKGHYSVVLKPGFYEIKASSQLYIEKTILKDIKSGEPLEVDMTLAPKNVTVHGKVLMNGYPISGVNITFSGYNSTFTAISNESGIYSIEIPAGRYSISVIQNISSDGSVRYEATHRYTAVFSAKHPSVNYNIEVEKRFEINGTLRMRGEPVNTTLWVSSENNTIPYVVNNGSFDLFLPEGKYVINATDANKTHGLFEGITVDSPMTLNLNMTEVYYVDITMSFQSKTKAGIPINILTSDGYKKTIWPKGNSVDVYLPSGKYSIVVNYTTTEPVEKILRNVTYTANKEIEVDGNRTISLSLSRSVPSGKISGHLYIASDYASNTSMEFTSTETGKIYECTTDSNGWFQLSAPMGEYVVYATGKSGDNLYSIMDRVVIGKNTEKDLHMVPAVSFSGKTIGNGTGIKSEISIIKLPEQEVQKRFKTDENGDFSIIVPKGMYSIVANGTAKVYGVMSNFMHQEDLNLTFSTDKTIVMEMTKVHRPKLFWNSDEEKAVEPGSNVTYHITVKNEGNCEDAYKFSGSPWTFTFSPSSVHLKPKESREITVIIHVPDDAKVNHEAVKIFATAEGGSKGSVTVKVDVKPVYGASVEIKKSSWEGSYALYEIAVKNTGNTESSFAITVDNEDYIEAQGWKVMLSKDKKEFSDSIELNVSAVGNETIYAKLVPISGRPAYSPELDIRVFGEHVDSVQRINAPLPSVEITPDISVQGDNIHIWKEHGIDMVPIYWAIGILVFLGAAYWVLKRKGVIM